VLYSRPYEIIAVATCKGIAIWHIGLNADADGGPSMQNVALLNGHDGEVQLKPVLYLDTRYLMQHCGLPGEYSVDTSRP
jgi:hypothetical protein